MSYTLGLATMDNSAASLFHGGDLVAAVEQERLSRVKNDSSFPHLAIRECLRMAGAGPEQVDRIAVYWQPWRIGTRGLGVLRKMAGSAAARKAIIARARRMLMRRAAPDPHDVSGSWGDLFRLRKILRRELGQHRAVISYYDHHLCHQLYGERMRDWDEMISLSYDGGGEAASTVLNAVTQDHRNRISLHRWPNSLGHYYSFFTGYLGFRMLEGEYKMMGLAPYGKPVFAETITRHVLHLEPRGRYRLNTALGDYHAALKGVFAPQMAQLFGPPRAPGQDPAQAHVDLAASVQKVYEDALIHLLRPARAAYPGLKRLVISGGCALNVTANGRLLDEGLFDEIIIPPAPHDAGCAIGACLADLTRRGIDADNARVRSPYLGAAPDKNQLAVALGRNCTTPPVAIAMPELIRRTAGLLADGLVVAWFQGRVEFGPRALGARSFLADPRREEIREELNRKIKKRELFRPFAPSVIAERAAEFFEIEQPSPYMNIVARVRDECAHLIPAVTHIDRTARVHTVARDANPLYHALLSRFGDLTGVPVLLNTSFNIQEPIVYSPQDAFATFRSSGVDALVIGAHIVTREHLA